MKRRDFVAAATVAALGRAVLSSPALASIEVQAFESPAAWRSSLNGLLKGAVPVFWNVSKA